MSNELDEDRFCIACGYNLRGLSSEQCPECGLGIDTARESAVAWEGRKEIGTVRAFWRTMLAGMFHAKRLAHAVAHPVDARSAMGFRVIVSLLAVAPVSALFWIVVCTERGTGFLSLWQPNAQSGLFAMGQFPSWWEIAILWSSGATMWAVLPVGAFIAVFLWTGVLGYWMRAVGMSDERSKRAVAVSAYVSGLLAMLFLPTIGFGVSWALWNLDGQLIQAICTGSLIFGFASSGAILAIYLSSAIRLISAMTRSGWVRKACAIAGLPVCWAIAAAIGLIGFPMLVGLVWLMVDSLRG